MLPFRQTFVFVVVVAALSTGYSYQKQYSKTTETENKYTNTVDERLVKANKLLLDDKISNQTQENYDKFNKQGRYLP